MKTSRQLVEGVLAGEDSAFDAFYDRYFDRTYLFCQRRSASREDAERLCRAVFESLLAQLGQYRAEWDLDAWVLAIALRTAARAGGPTRAAVPRAAEVALEADG
jgi:DNA-directed RNA polymerase specialized sigma24 family protein